ATAELAKGTESRVVEDTRFWVVRPRISGSTVSGLQTLLSGSYVAMDAGKSTQRARVFTGLEQPPAFTTDAPGRQVTLRADDIGSLDRAAAGFASTATDCFVVHRHRCHG